MAAQHHAPSADDERRAADREGRRADAFRELWDAHHARVRAYLVRRVGVQDADDLVAAVFETAWRRWTSVPTDESRLWWLLACANKICANHRRSLTRRANLAERVRGGVRAGTGDFAEQLVVDAEVRKALAGLSPGDREVLLLAVWDDLDAEGVAAVLGIGVAAAQKRVARARERFEKRYVGVSADGHDRTLTGKVTP